MQGLLAILAAVVVGTWNGNWFPSGRAEHRAAPEVEAATIAASAKMLASGLRNMDPSGTNDVILCLNEIRGPRVASNLVAQIGRRGLRVAVVTGYRRRDRFDQQQDVIATTLPVSEAHWSKWRNAGTDTPPRGYAFAAVVLDPATTANVYAVHLKSDFGAKDPVIVSENATKRLLAVSQLVEQEKPKRGKGPRRPVIVAGDLNADRWLPESPDARLFVALEKAGFTNLLAGLPPSERCTHPSPKFGDRTFDYVFCRGLESAARPQTVRSEGLSDHDALFANVRSADR